VLPAEPAAVASGAVVFLYVCTLVLICKFVLYYFCLRQRSPQTQGQRINRLHLNILTISLSCLHTSISLLSVQLINGYLIVEVLDYSVLPCYLCISLTLKCSLLVNILISVCIIKQIFFL